MIFSYFQDKWIQKIHLPLSTYTYIYMPVLHIHVSFQQQKKMGFYVISYSSQIWLSWFMALVFCYQIWNHCKKIKQYDVLSQEKHGKICPKDGNVLSWKIVEREREREREREERDHRILSLVCITSAIYFDWLINCCMFFATWQYISHIRSDKVSILCSRIPNILIHV